MSTPRAKPSLDRAATYQIKVPGEIDEAWADWIEGLTIAVQWKGDDAPVTILTATIDQATLQGLLRQLYALGVPLISVQCFECDSEG